MSNVLHSDFTGSVHKFPVRVYYEDTDAAGIVYYANYLRFAERARTEMIRALGIQHARLLESDGVFFAVRRCVVDFLSPARLDDPLTVVSNFVGVGGASLRMQQTIQCEMTDLVRLDVRLACMSLTGKPSRIPQWLRNTFTQFLDQRA